MFQLYLSDFAATADCLLKINESTIQKRNMLKMFHVKIDS